MQECAVRETVEELQILPTQIEVLGPGDIYLSPFNLMIHPYIGVIKDYQDTFGTDEVDEIIKVPLDFFREHPPEKYESKLVHQLPEDFPYEWIQGGREYPWAKGSHDILFYRYENWTIWGMTALMLKSAVDLMKAYEII
ncbi:MAG: hydrolase [Herbinix sp.]|nr:hydrolase [Herbinix sp.]